MEAARLLLTCTTVMVLAHFRFAEGHGHLLDPPARSSMWREGFKTPRNYNDNQLNCGGYYNQWGVHDGKCGICGDPYQNPQPRDNESGGRYGKGIVTRTYQAGQEVTFKILITANHLGWFEFRMCPDGSPTTPVTQACLDRYVLQMADGSGERFDLGARYNTVQVKVKLPDGVTCKQCVLQWRWHAGNSFGQDTQGNWCKGCGPQEEFYGCADFAISSSAGQTAKPGTPRPLAPITNAPVTFAPVTFAPVTFAPVTFAPVTNAPVTFAPITAAPQNTLRPFFTPPPNTFRPVTNPPVTAAPQSTRPPFLTFPPVTYRPATDTPINPPRTLGPVYPPFRPISFPYFTTAPTVATRPTAAPYTPTQQPIRTQAPGTGNGNLPTGFVPISADPANPRTPVPTTRFPFIRPSITTPRVFTFPPPRTTPRPLPVITTRRPAQRPDFFRPPTTARPQLPFTFRPQTTPGPIITRPTQPVTYKPIVFTLFRPTSTTTKQTSVRTTRKQTPIPTTARPIIFTLRPNRTPLPTRSPVVTAPAPRCFGINSWGGVAELDAYCNAQCQMVGGQCPGAFCACA